MLKPGIYRGKSSAEFGLWRLRQDGRWLFCVPVLGREWKRVEVTPEDAAKLIPLVDGPTEYEYQCLLVDKWGDVKEPLTRVWSGPNAEEYAKEHRQYCTEGKIQRRPANADWEDVE